MEELKSRRISLGTSFRVGLFLAVRQIRRSNVWTNALIIFIMTLTFLNLVVVSGILVGLVEGISQAVHVHYLGDIFISSLQNRQYIDQTSKITNLLDSTPGVRSYSPRYIEGGTLQSDYKEQITKKKPNETLRVVSAQFAGIDPEREDATTNLSKMLIRGKYLEPDDYDQVLLGANLLQQYLGFESDAMPALRNVDVGSKIKATVNGNTREVRVKGIVKSKVDEIDRRIFFTGAQLRSIIGRFDYNADEIAIKLSPSVDPNLIKNDLVDNGAAEFAKVQTPKDAEPKFVKDIRDTFALLGNAISSIGLAVASITVFIVIFISAITHRKFIGILKGVGITSRSIEIAYILQSVFYAVVGTAIGSVIIFGFLKPYFSAHPINFPFSDGILVVDLIDTAIRIGILFITTLVAGYVPARIVVKQNTLDAILGR